MGDAARAGTRAEIAALICVGFALWLLNHPYLGLWHDARVYALDAAALLHPQQLGGDLYFRFGSQGSLTIFVPLYAWLINWLGLDLGARVVVVVGALGWSAATAMLALRILGHGGAAWFATLAAAVMTVSYSPNGSTFEITEGFATARSLAFPCGLGSVAALMWTRRGMAWTLATISTLLHPLLGIWALALIAMAGLHWRWCLALAAGGFGFTLVLALLDLQTPHLRLMDVEWLTHVQGHVPDVLFNATAGQLPEYICALVALVVAIRLGTSVAKPFYRRILLLGTTGLMLALVASSFGPIEVLVQGQAWRVFWLVLPLAGLGLVDAGRNVWRSGGAGRVLIGAAVFAGTQSTLLMATTLVAVVCASYVAAPTRARFATVLGRYERACWLAICVAALACIPGWLVDLARVGNRFSSPVIPGSDVLEGILFGGTLALPALVAAAALLVKRTTLRMPAASGLLLLIGVVLATTVWDRRAPLRRQVESCYLAERCLAHPFRALTQGQTVYWDNEELKVWFLLRSASYFGSVQGIGTVFSQRKLDESRRRGALVSAADRGRGLGLLCADSAVDWVVLNGAENCVGAQARDRRSALYRCDDVRAGSAFCPASAS